MTDTSGVSHCLSGNGLFAVATRLLQSQLPAKRSVARATSLRRSRSVQLVQKLGAGLRDVLRASVMLPERSDKQQQQNQQPESVSWICSEAIRGRRWGRRCSKHRSTRPTASHTSLDAARTRPSTDPVGRSRPVPWRASPSPPSRPPPSRACRGRHTCEHKIQY